MLAAIWLTNWFAQLTPAEQALLIDHRAGLQAQLEAITQQFPALPCDEALMTYVNHRIRNDAQPQSDAEQGRARLVSRFRLDDIALVAWALRSSDGVAAFAERYRAVFATVGSRFAKLDTSELRQRSLVKLFVKSDESAKIEDYSGFGFLENWLKVTAMRDAIDLVRAEQNSTRQLELDDLIASDATSPTGAVYKREVREQLKLAFSNAVKKLEARERNFLRHTVLEQQSLDQIATTYQVHRATVARVLASARGTMLASMRAELGNAGSDLSSILQLLAGNLDLSISRVMRD